MEARTTTAWACQKAKEPLTQISFELAPLKADEVEVKVLACGVCFSDADAVMGHYDAMGTYIYPIVAGHEAVGVITALGSAVTHLKMGDRVGLGPFRSCCTACSACLEGNTNICKNKMLIFAKGNKGAFAEYVRIKALFALGPVPDAIPTDLAAPLFCAGLTTFAPFRNHNIMPGQKVGVLGIGGLGHLALQFARGFGCEVYALSTSASKQEEAKKLGVHHFVVTSDPEQLKAVQGELDYIMFTANTGIDFKLYTPLLAPNGKLVLMGNPGLNVNLSAVDLIMGQKGVCGSAAGSPKIAKDMLNFCRLHNIRPIIETFSFNDINEAMERVKKGDVRYRAVLLHPEVTPTAQQ